MIIIKKGKQIDITKEWDSCTCSEVGQDAIFLSDFLKVVCMNKAMYLDSLAL